MTDVVIRRCTLRVVRRGGWSWGADPRRLLRGAVEALPALLAARLAAMGWEGDEEIAEPLRLRIPVRLWELVEAAGAAGGAGPAPAVEARLASALEAALAGRPERPGGGAAPGEEPSAPGTADPPPGPGGSLLLDRLVDWRRRGLLPAVLAALPASLLELWLRRLVGGAAPPPETSDAPEEARPGLEPALKRLLGEAPSLPPAARRLLLVAGAAAELGLPPGDPALAPDLGRLAAGSPVPRPEERGPSPAGEPEAGPDAVEVLVAVPRVEGSPSRPAPEPVLPRADLRPQLEGDVRVASALPWLLLGPLSRMGYLSTLAAALELAGEEPSAPCFAAALAYKVLPQPERGWHRTAEAAATAAAFAGVEAPIPDALLARFAGRFDPFLDLVDADLAQGTLAGREQADPLLLASQPAEVGGGLLLLDLQGLFPVAWIKEGAEGAEELAAILRCGAGAEAPLGSFAVLLVATAAACPALLAGLDAAGLPFVTPAPPARGERWQRLPGAPGRWWTNRPSRRPAALGRWLQDFDDLAARAGELARELTARRPEIPHAAVTHLERSVTLAAASALGTLAWTLWRDREPPDPLLAFERFADLDGRVRFTRDTVHLSLPLGKRHRDLYHAGLLPPVRDVPWLGGRTVEITGG